MNVGQVTDRLHDLRAIHPFFFDLADNFGIDFFRLGYSKRWKTDRECGCQSELLHLLFLFHDLQGCRVRKNIGWGNEVESSGNSAASNRSMGGCPAIVLISNAALHYPGVALWMTGRRVAISRFQSEDGFSDGFFVTLRNHDACALQAIYGVSVVDAGEERTQRDTAFANKMVKLVTRKTMAAELSPPFRIWEVVPVLSP